MALTAKFTRQLGSFRLQVDLTAENGAPLALLGASGSGKSLTLGEGKVTLGAGGTISTPGSCGRTAGGSSWTTPSSLTARNISTSRPSAVGLAFSSSSTPSSPT